MDCESSRKTLKGVRSLSSTFRFEFTLRFSGSSSIPRHRRLFVNRVTKKSCTNKIFWLKLPAITKLWTYVSRIINIYSITNVLNISLWTIHVKKLHITRGLSLQHLSWCPHNFRISWVYTYLFSTFSKVIIEAEYDFLQIYLHHYFTRPIIP